MRSREVVPHVDGVSRGSSESHACDSERTKKNNAHAVCAILGGVPCQNPRLNATARQTAHQKDLVTERSPAIVVSLDAAPRADRATPPRMETCSPLVKADDAPGEPRSARNGEVVPLLASLFATLSRVAKAILDLLFATPGSVSPPVPFREVRVHVFPDEAGSVFLQHLARPDRVSNGSTTFTCEIHEAPPPFVLEVWEAGQVFKVQGVLPALKYLGGLADLWPTESRTSPLSVVVDDALDSLFSRYVVSDAPEASKERSAALFNEVLQACEDGEVSPPDWEEERPSPPTFSPFLRGMPEATLLDTLVWLMWRDELSKGVMRDEDVALLYPRTRKAIGLVQEEQDGRPS